MSYRLYSKQILKIYFEFDKNGRAYLAIKTTIFLQTGNVIIQKGETLY